VQQSTREQAYIGKDEYLGGLDRSFGYFCSIFPDKHYYSYLGRGGIESRSNADSKPQIISIRLIISIVSAVRF
jgi:hypothetical protein